MLNVRQRRLKAEREEVTRLVDFYGANRVADALNAHRTTVARWLKGTAIPLGTAKRIKVAFGELWGEWEGWRIGDDGNMYAPTNERYHPGDLLGRQYQIQLIKHLQRQVKLLEKKMADLNQADHAGAANDPVAGAL